MNSYQEGAELARKVESIAKELGAELWSGSVEKPSTSFVPSFMSESDAYEWRDRNTIRFRIVHVPEQYRRAAIHFKVKGDRLAIYGEYPQTTTRARGGDWHATPTKYELHTDLPSITVAMTRTAAQIAADIRRRFLPQYFSEFEKIAKICQENSREQYGTMVLSARLAREYGLDADHDRLWRSDRDGGPGVTIVLNYWGNDHGHHADLIHLTDEQLDAVLAALK